jgi:hypothetical protein
MIDNVGGERLLDVRITGLGLDGVESSFLATGMQCAPMHRVAALRKHRVSQGVVDDGEKNTSFRVSRILFACSRIGQDPNQV